MNKTLFFAFLIWSIPVFPRRSQRNFSLARAGMIFSNVLSQRPPGYNVQATLVSTDHQGNVPVQSDPPTPRRKIWFAPNPAGVWTWVQVLDPQARNLVWQLRRSTGEVARQGFSPTPGFYLDLEGLPKGIYVLRFPDTDIPPEKLVVTGE